MAEGRRGRGGPAADPAQNSNPAVHRVSTALFLFFGKTDFPVREGHCPREAGLKLCCSPVSITLLGSQNRPLIRAIKPAITVCAVGPAGSNPRLISSTQLFRGPIRCSAISPPSDQKDAPSKGPIARARAGVEGAGKKKDSKLSNLA